MLSPIFAVAALLLSYQAQETASVRPPQSTAATEGQTFRISGTVVDAITGQPLAQADVSISSTSPSSAQIIRSGNDGSFAFENVAPGKYVLSARRRGYLAQNYQQHETFTTAIVVGPGLETENLRFRLAPVAKISGQVTDEMGEPVRNAQVLIFEQNTVRGKRATRIHRRGSTDDQGYYHFGHLEPGTYFIAVSAHPWYAINNAIRRFQSKQGSAGDFGPMEEHDPVLDVVYPATFFTNATDIGGAAPITLHSGDVQTADFTLRAIAALHILVKTPVSDEAQNSFVQVTQALTENMQEYVQANSQNVAPGLVEVSGLPPGRFKLQVTTSKGNESVVHSRTVEVAGDTQVDSTDTSMSPIVSGTINLDDGSPLPQAANVQLRNIATGEFINIRSDPSGEFSFKQNAVAAGTYEIIVFAQVGTVVRSLTATGAKVTGHNLQISGLQDVRVAVVVTKASGSITGYAIKGGKPAGGVMVVLVPQDAENNEAVFRRDQSDSDGSFTLTAIPPGTFTVLALENGWELEWTNPRVLQRYLPGGEKVQVGLGAKLELKLAVQ